MVETERVEVSGFNREEYQKNFQIIYGMVPEVEKLADVIYEEGFEKLFLLGIGGTYIELGGLKKLMEGITNLPIYLLNAGEANAAHPRNLSPKDIVLTSSFSGDTKEILEAAKWMKEAGIRVVATTKAEKPLAKIVTHVILTPEIKSGGLEFGYLIADIFALRLLNRRGEFDGYEKFKKEMAFLGEDLYAVRMHSEEKNREAAAVLAKEPYAMYIGSGITWYEVWMFSMCILEEMQWVRTRPVASQDFFHGPLELVDKNVPVVLMKGEGDYRKLDERVERFIRQHSDKVFVYDTMEYALPHISGEFRVITSQMIATVLLTGRLSYFYQLNTGHNLAYRRYYRQMDY